ncbi:unnamed protein product [Schistosoma turkestanicum]|nr:unnamed protein product [Schistosoma turkestanicum]
MATTIQIGQHDNINILLDFNNDNNKTNNLHNFKLSSYGANDSTNKMITLNDPNPDPDHHYQFIPKQICSLPIIHWNYCTLNEIVPSSLFKNNDNNLKQSTINNIHHHHHYQQQFTKYLNQFENMIKNQINLINYNLLLNILVDQLSMLTMYHNKLELLNSRALDIEDLLYYFNIQCHTERKTILQQHNDLIQTIIGNCLNAMNLMQIQIQLEGDNLSFNEHITKQFISGLMNKFIHGLRITRLLNRIKNRLLINHGDLLKRIIRMIPNISIMNETLMNMPMKVVLLTEPLLHIEEICCKHFLRLCIESFISHYLTCLDVAIKTAINNNDDMIQFRVIT